MASLPDQISEVRTLFLGELKEAAHSKDLEDLRVKYLGKKGPVQALMLELKHCTPEERPRYGKIINDLKEELVAHIDHSLARVRQSELDEQLQAEWLDISAKLARLGAEHARRQAEIATVRELIAKLEATLPIAKAREADFKSLTDQGFISAHAGQDRTRERIEQERDLATQQARLVEAQSTLTESDQTRIAYTAEALRLLSERHTQANLKRQQLIQELGKNEQRSRLTQLTAAVAGTVQQVAVHTEGGVVTPAQVLMIIVPKDAEVTAEVTVDNKDIGFVNAGDAAQIKLETFPFTRYGTIDARVKSVTADAVNDEKKGAIFPATLTLGKATIDIDGKRINLSPGMNVTAEIKTGKRRVIEYLLSPVQRAMKESLGER
jgi:hemolysin D